MRNIQKGGIRMPFSVKDEVLIVSVIDTGEVHFIPAPDRYECQRDKDNTFSVYPEECLRLLPHEKTRIPRPNFYLVVSAPRRRHIKGWVYAGGIGKAMGGRICKIDKKW